VADTGQDASPMGAFDPPGRLLRRETGRLSGRKHRRHREHVVLMVQATGRLVRLAELAAIHKTLFHIFFENGIIIEINGMIVVQIVLHRYRIGLDLGCEIRLGRGGGITIRALPNG